MKTTAKPMTIGAAARQAGVGVETIRFYERRGLVQQPLKPASSGLRHYSPEVVARVRFIREAQQIGFSLREIRELLSLRAEPDADCSEVREQAQGKLDEVERKIAQLEHVKAALKSLLATCPGRGNLAACSILDALILDSQPGQHKESGPVSTGHPHGVAHNGDIR